MQITLPNNLQEGTVAFALKVMENFNAIIVSINAGIEADNIADGVIGDNHLGNRTVNQAVTITSTSTGELTYLLSVLAKVQKGVTGKTNWFDLPDYSISQIKTLVDGAVTNANAAVVTANAADGKADTAVTTANTALGQDLVEPYTGALGAMKIAIDVETDYTLIKPELEQAVLDVASKASVDYVDQVALDFQMGEVLDGSIAKVKLTSALQADIPQNKFDATVAPAVSNDTTEGYSVGSLWINTTAKTAYVCTDASTGAAVWELYSGLATHITQEATTSVRGHMSATDKTKLDGVDTGADATGVTIHGATAKTAPVDADTTALIDSAASNTLKKVTWANIKATLKTYFDTLYNNYVHPTTAGNKHIPTGGAAGQVVGYGGASGTGAWVAPDIKNAAVNPLYVVYESAEIASNNTESSMTYSGNAWVSCGKTITIDCTSVNYLQMDYEIQTGTTGSWQVGIRLKHNTTGITLCESLLAGEPSTYQWRSARDNVVSKGIPTGNQVFTIEIYHQSTRSVQNRGCNGHKSETFIVR